MNNDVNSNTNLIEVKKWSLLSEEEKKFYVGNFLENYQQYTNTKVFTGIKNRFSFSIKSIISRYVRTYAIAFIFLIVFVFLANFINIGLLIFLAILFFGFYSFFSKLYSGLRNIASIKDRKSNKKDKGEMFVDYLYENNVIFDSDVKPAMVLEVYKD